MRCVFSIKYFTMLDILEKLWNFQLLQPNSYSSCIKIEFCIFRVQHLCNWIMFEHKTHCVSRKNRKFSNFAWCVLRDKVITNLDTHYAARSVKRRRLNNTLDGRTDGRVHKLEEPKSCLHPHLTKKVAPFRTVHPFLSIMFFPLRFFSFQFLSIPFLLFRLALPPSPNILIIRRVVV